MKNLHDEILDSYFWKSVDGGAIPESTPLFTGIFEGETLHQSIVLQFGVSMEDAEMAIEEARQEVAL